MLRLVFWPVSFSPLIIFYVCLFFLFSCCFSVFGYASTDYFRLTQMSSALRKAFCLRLVFSQVTFCPNNIYFCQKIGQQTQLPQISRSTKPRTGNPQFSQTHILYLHRLSGQIQTKKHKISSVAMRRSTSIYRDSNFQSYLPINKFSANNVSTCCSSTHIRPHIVRANTLPRTGRETPSSEKTPIPNTRTQMSDS